MQGDKAMADERADDPSSRPLPNMNETAATPAGGKRAAWGLAPVLSIVIPVYNEVSTLGRVLVEVAKALPEVSKQIVIVDDRSIDGTSDWLRKNLSRTDRSWHRLSLNGGGDLELCADGPADHAEISFTVLFHERNRGKGAAVRTGLTSVSGDVIVIQDADLEYDPNDWGLMLPLIVERKVADVVYASRFYGRPHRSLYFHHYLGNRLISFLFNLLYDQMLSDIEVCYKMFTREVLNDLKLTSDDFGFEIEMSAQIARARRWRIYEVGISYYGRTYAEGKKIAWKDGFKALYYLVKFRIIPLQSSKFNK
jgi:glycosyltransferase involved in cell wall biosynthesis